ncbi:uroplakin-3b [Latimeria chalumnae]|uniref:uroplakin-3b n=1 Tax=Latimeria chalumnae TaxID=7897 RepID=UPI0003C1B3A5|nr:PREDICTED: uroplakin-3b-like protein [Latimeria chalumnae]|eukprot:XP_005986909.1 PREDICTED: uroplakin-3b-like protein [Latimeria chalumnae]
MKHLVLSLLALALFSCTAAQDVPYLPEVAFNNVAGSVTATTFTLQQPRCIFKDVFSSCPLCQLWVAVATEKGANNLITTVGRPVTFAGYQKLSQRGYYFTMRSSKDLYKCVENDDKVRVLRLGADTSCPQSIGESDCNGPLPDSGSYRARFLIVDSQSGNMLKAQSQWSKSIQLKRPKDPASIDTWPGKRTGGMVVVTTILVILLAILLLLFIVALITACSNMCRGSQSITETVAPTPKGSLKIKRYNTHNMQPQSVVNPQGLP